jgi:hypothetical protein
MTLNQLVNMIQSILHKRPHKSNTGITITHKIGYQYVSPEEAMEFSGGRTSSVLLEYKYISL